MITEARTALAELLTEVGFRTFDYVPPNIVPPCAVIFPNSEWVAAGETYGEYTIGFEVRVFAQAVTNQVATVNVDQYAEDLLVGIHDAENFYLGEISAPEAYNENNNTFLGIQATVFQRSRI